MNKQEMINSVYQDLKDRKIHPSGTFDNGGRFYATNDDLIRVREPSRRFPYSQLNACRTKKYVTKCWHEFECETIEDLIHNV